MATGDMFIKHLSGMETRELPAPDTRGAHIGGAGPMEAAFVV